MSRQPSTTLSHPHRSRRRLRIVFVLLLLLLLGGVGYWWFFLRLAVVSRQELPGDTGILFSAWNMGYPALLGEKSSRAGSETVHWLDDHGLRQTGNVGPYYPGMFRLSPHRNIAARVEPHTIDRQQVILTSDDGQSHTITHRNTYYNTIRWVADDGSYCTCDDRLFDAQGRRISIPAGFRPTNFLCADPRYLALESNFQGWATRPYREKLLIYDRMAKRFIATPRYKWRGMRGMVFQSGDRFLAVPEMGEAIVFTSTRIIGRFGAPYAEWRWGEDGSAWGIIWKKSQFLVWRKGDCHLEVFPRLPAYAPEVGDLTNAGRDTISLYWISAPANLAVWSDGEYIAISETVPISPLRKQLMKQWVRHASQPAVMNYRRVTLYRRGRYAGSYRLPLESGSLMYVKGRFIRVTRPGPPPGTGAFITTGSRIYQEHLAFTVDGKHLAWLLQEGGKLHLTVFAVR